MDKPFTIKSVLFLVIVSSFFACQKNDEIQAENSLMGVWDITTVSSTYGEFFDNGFDPTETITESAPIGSFHFKKDVVEYDFSRNDTLFTGTASWQLDLEKVRSGFFRENKFTLTIEDHFLFDVSFEDSTRNAEKDAKSVTFLERPSSGFGVLIEMALEK